MSIRGGLVTSPSCLSKTQEHMSAIMWFMLNPEDLVEEFGEEAAAELNADLGVEIEIHHSIVEQNLGSAEEPSLQSKSSVPGLVAPCNLDVLQPAQASISVDLSEQPRTSGDCSGPINSSQKSSRSSLMSPSHSQRSRREKV